MSHVSVRRTSALIAATLVFAGVVASFDVSCTVKPQEIALFEPVTGTKDLSRFEASGVNGAVAAAHPLASQAALEILRAGGNAVDAAVAASFMISVVRPQSTGLGGGGFLLAFEGATKTTEAYDFRERAPSAASARMFLDAKGEPADFKYKGQVIEDSALNGHLAVGVPGLVAGLVRVHQEHGKLPLATVIEPAIGVAEGGFAVYPELARAIVERQAIMLAFESTQKIFLPNKKPLAAGDKLVQTDLAKTLRLIAKNGAAGFYQGAVAQRITAEMRRGHGLITQKDLASYQVKKRLPVRGTYRGYNIVSMPPPSSGGAHIVQILNTLAGDDVRQSGFATIAGVHLLTEAMRRAFADRARYLGDPDFFKVPLAGLVNPQYGAALRATIDLTKATPSNTLKAPQPQAFESNSTTHISVVDRWGNAVSTTQTINFTFGSCVVAEGTGVVLNDEMDDFAKKPGVANAYGLVGSDANAVAPGKTPLSSMSPTLVFTDAGQLHLVVGSPGGPRIITATLQTILNVLDHGMPLLQAVQAKRIHHQWMPDELRLEPGALVPAVQSQLEAMGHSFKAIETIGDVQAIARTKAGWTAVSDARSTGAPMAY